MSSAIPIRANVPETDKWDLTHLFTDVSKWQEDFTWLQREYPKLDQWKGRVGESAQTLAGVIELEKVLEQKMERVYHYASLQAAEDSTNNEYLARIGQVLADGEVELAIAGIPTLLPVKGVQIVGPLPAELQNSFVNTAGISAAAKEPDAAKALIKYLATPEAASVIRAKGLEPLGR